jgi:hypothetical protein
MTERGAAAERLLKLARRGHDPSEADLQRVRARLHARYLAAPLVLAPKIAHGLGTASKLALSKVLIPLSIGLGLGAVGTVGASYVFRAPSIPAAVPSAAQHAPVAHPAANRVRVPAPEAAPSEPDVAPAQPAPAVKEATAGAPTPAASPTPSSSLSGADLEIELDGLRRAQRLLHTGHAAESLMALDALAARVAGGGLAEERAATRAMALCSLGQRGSTEVDAFLARYPRSVHASGVRAVCSRASFDLAPGNKTESQGSDH